MGADLPPDTGDEGTEAARKGYLLRGRVQGVGFRWWAARTARELGLAGTVRNRRDGTVELHAEGPPAVLRRLEERLQVGPPAARVDALQEIPPARKLPRDFRIVG